MNKQILVRFVLGVAAFAIFGGVAMAQQGGPYSYYTVTPCRVFDTRNTSSPIAGGTTVNFQVRGTCGIPMSAKAVSYNLAVVLPTMQTHLILWASGDPRPSVSAINVGANDLPTSNGGVVALSTNAQDLSVYNAFGSVHVIFDVTGYFQ